MSEKRPGRPALTEEQREARRVRKNERNKKYYASRKDEILERRAERYDPLEAQEKYQQNKEDILERQRTYYMKRKNQIKEQHLSALEELGGVRSIGELYENLKNNLDGVQVADLEALTRLVLLHVYTNPGGVKKSDEPVEIDINSIPISD